MAHCDEWSLYIRAPRTRYYQILRYAPKQEYQAHSDWIEMQKVQPSVREPPDRSDRSDLSVRGVCVCVCVCVCVSVSVSVCV